MEQNRFFKFVSRFNAVALMVMIISVLILGGIFIIRIAVNAYKPAVIKNVADDPKGNEKWRLGSVRNINGTNYLYVPLESENKELPRSGGSSYESEYLPYFNPSRNILFVNKTSQNMHWLFKSNNQLIDELRLVARGDTYVDKKTVEAIIYQVYSRDTNGDGRLTKDDSAELAISYPDGTGYVEFLKSVERLIGVEMLPGKEILVIYQSNGNGFNAKIKLGEGEKANIVEMPKI